jgi:hypothetical protein
VNETQQGFNPNRVVGVPSKNGEFDFAQQAEQPESTTMKLYDRGTGTCFNPPMASTAESALAFWQEVDIPDITIERARTLYAAQQSQDFADYFKPLSEAHMDAWEDQNSRPRFSDSKEREWIRNRMDEEKEYAQRTVDEERAKFFHADNPEYLGNTNAQQIVRAWFTYRAGPNPERLPVEAAKLFAHSVELIEGSDTIGGLWDRFRLWRFSDQLNRVPDPATDAIHQMQDALVGILRSVSDNTSRTASNTTPLEM